MEPVDTAAEIRHPGSGSASTGDTQTFQDEKILDALARKRLYHKNKRKEKRDKNKRKWLAKNFCYFQTHRLTKKKIQENPFFPITRVNTIILNDQDSASFCAIEKRWTILFLETDTKKLPSASTNPLNQP